MDLKHIDLSPPLDVIKRVWEGILAKRWTDLAFWADAMYLVTWALAFLAQKTKPDDPIFGSRSPEEAAFCRYCVNIHDWATDNQVVVQSSAIGAWLVKAMLLALLNRLLREFAANGIPDWIAKIIQDIKDQIEAL